MNWRSPLEMGVRLINWVWTLDLIGDADVIDAELTRAAPHGRRGPRSHSSIVTMPSARRRTTT
jgi:hypothetical protein